MKLINKSWQPPHSPLYVNGTLYHVATGNGSFNIAAKTYRAYIMNGNPTDGLFANVAILSELNEMS